MPKTSAGDAQGELPLFHQVEPHARAGPSTDRFSYQQIMDAFAQYVAEDRPRLETPADVAGLMRPVLAGKNQEEFHVLLVDTKHRLVGDELVTIGLLDRTQVHAREVFRSAISRGNCSRLILVHQHPSGDPTPSAQDIASTRDLVAAGKIIGIEVIDHVILGKRSQSRPRDYLSFREESLLADL
jgi:DNA repair protein RadC